MEAVLSTVWTYLGDTSNRKQKMDMLSYSNNPNINSSISSISRGFLDFLFLFHGLWLFGCRRLRFWFRWRGRLFDFGKFGFLIIGGQGFIEYRQGMRLRGD